MANKKISDLPQIPLTSFDSDEDYLIVQKNESTSPTFRAHVSNVTSSAQSSDRITLFDGKKSIFYDMPNIGHASGAYNPPAENRERDVYDLTGLGVPKTASAAYVSFDHHGSGYPALVFNYYKNATTSQSHRFEYWYNRAIISNHTLWMPLDDGKLHIQWVWVYFHTASCSLYLHGYV